MHATRRALVVVAAIAAILATLSVVSPDSAGRSGAVAAASEQVPPSVVGGEHADAVALGDFLAAFEAHVAEVGRAEAEWYAGVQRAAEEAARQAALRSAPTAQRVSSGSGASGDWLDRLAQCECGGNPSCNTGNGFYGTFQFTLSTWRAVGGEGLPSDASYEEQKMRAGALLERASAASQFPGCTAKLGSP
jgi:Transglycosylase-like domain